MDNRQVEKKEEIKIHNKRQQSIKSACLSPYLPLAPDVCTYVKLIRVVVAFAVFECVVRCGVTA